MVLTNAITCSFHISKLFDYKQHVLKLVGILARENNNYPSQFVIQQIPKIL